MSAALSTGERRVLAFTDGACKGNPGPGGYAFVLRDLETGTEAEAGFAEAGKTTNNRMELRAVIAALRKIPPGAAVTVFSDSQYVVKGMTEWLAGWKARGWVTAGRKPVDNRDLWEDLETVVGTHSSVRFAWVRGHAGHPENERADRLARAAAERAAPRT